MSNIASAIDRSQMFHRHFLFSGLAETRNLYWAAAHCRVTVKKKRNGVGLTGNVKYECVLSDIQSFCSTHDFFLSVTEMLQSANRCHSITYCLCAKLKGNVWLTIGARRIFALYDLRINVWIWNCQKKFKWQLKKTPLPLHCWFPHIRIACAVAPPPGPLGPSLK